MKKVLCETCQQSMYHAGCQSCVSGALSIIDVMTEAVESIPELKNNKEKTEKTNNNESEKENDKGLTQAQIMVYKQSCRVVMNDLNEIERVDPYDCPFYFSTAYKLF